MIFHTQVMWLADRHSDQELYTSAKHCAKIHLAQLHQTEEFLNLPLCLLLDIIKGLVYFFPCSFLFKFSNEFTYHMKIILCERTIAVFISVIVLYKKMWSSSFNQTSLCIVSVWFDVAATVTPPINVVPKYLCILSVGGYIIRLLCVFLSRWRSNLPESNSSHRVVDKSQQGGKRRVFFHSPRKPEGNVVFELKMERSCCLFSSH